MTRAAGLLLTIVAAALTGVAADDALVLDGPEVFKLDWNTRAMRAHDVDLDGRTDLVLLNNDRAKLEILYQKKHAGAEPGAEKQGARWKPVLDDTRFRRESVVTGIKMFDLAVGDLDGDGRPDLAFTGAPDGLTVFYQGSGGNWKQEQTIAGVEPNQWGSTIAVEDLDGDGAAELLVLASKELLYLRRGEGGRLSEPRRYPLGDEDCYGLRVEDVDGDGRRDVMYLVAKNSHPLRVRFQDPAGGLGFERMFRIEEPRGVLHRVRDVDGEPPVYAAVQAKTGVIELMRLGAPSKTDAFALSPRVYSTPTEENEPQAYTLGDFDGDGRVDLAVADRKGAQVWLYAQGSDGSFAEPLAFPSLSDLRAVTAGDLDGDGDDELFVVSTRERVIGWSRLEPSGRLGYPSPIETDGKVLAATAADLDGDGRLELAYVQTKGREREVVVLAAENNGAAWTETQRLKLADLRTDPRAIETLDADQDGRIDLAVFTQKNPVRLLLQRSDGAFEEAASRKGFQQGLVDDLLPGALSAGDVDGDGKPELLVAGQGFARALRLGADGSFEVLDQFNTAEREKKVLAALAADLDGDGAAEILLAVEDSPELAALQRDRKGVYRQKASISTGPIALVDARVLDLDGNGVDDLLYVGRDRFWVVPLAGADLQVESLELHESDIDDQVYMNLATGDLDGDGAADLVALDSRQTRILEVLRVNPWRRMLHFSVFESDPHYSGRQGAGAEPRELVLADLTADGRTDIALLVHDRVLLYPVRPGVE